MKKILKLYLEEEDIKRLRVKSKEAGFDVLSHYITRISREPIIFLSEDVKAILRLLNQNNKET